MQETFFSANQPIPLDVALPPGTAAPGVSERKPAILLLHGAGGNVGYWFSTFSAPVAEAGVALFAPHYFASTGTTFAGPQVLEDGISVPRWLTVLDDCLRAVAAHPAVDPNRIAIVGMSLGAFLALAFAAQLSASEDPEDRNRLRCLVELSGGLVEPYATLATPGFPPTLGLHGADDTTVPAIHAQRLNTRLTELGIDHHIEIFPNEGHWFSQSIAPKLLLLASNFLQKHIA